MMHNLRSYDFGDEPTAYVEGVYESAQLESDWETAREAGHELFERVHRAHSDARDRMSALFAMGNPPGDQVVGTVEIVSELGEILEELRARGVELTYLDVNNDKGGLN